MVAVVNVDCKCLKQLAPSFINIWMTQLKLKLLAKGFLLAILPRAAFRTHRSLDVFCNKNLVQILAAILSPLVGAEDLRRFISFV